MPTTPLPPCAECAHPIAHTKLSGCLHMEGATFCPCRVYVPPAPTVVSSPTITQARAERDAALEQVEAAASPEWLEWAARAIGSLVSAGRPFSTDDVWEFLAATGVQPPREPRALGPVVKRALARGVIQPDGFTQSRRRHAAVIRTYVGAR